MVRWEFFKELDDLRREIEEAFQHVGYTRPSATTFLTPAASRRFPLVNLSEDDGHVYVDALVPGVNPQEIDLSVLRNAITIAGERKPFAEQSNHIIHRSELGSGKFSRTVELPVDIDPDKIEAECRDGIMRVTLAKSEHAKPRKIEIAHS